MFKKYIFSVFIFVLPVLGMAQEEQASIEGPYLTFEEAKHDFGDIFQGDQVEYTFEFRNSGTTPLILSNVLVQCGCTATEWPRDPIAPGKKGSLTVNFNSEGKMGIQTKVITIVSNAVNNHERVRIVSNVLPK